MADPTRVWRGGELRAKRQTLGAMLLERCQVTPNRPAVMYRADGGWKTLTYREYEKEVHDVAMGLLAIGLQPGERVLLASQTRHEWNLVDFAVLLVGGVVVPAFPTLLPKTVLHEALDSGCAVAIVEDAEQLAKIAEIRDSLPRLRMTVTIDRTGKEDGRLVYHLDDVREVGRTRPALEREYNRRVAAVKPDDRASVVYTSGTTGLPRGATLTHWNFIAATAGALQVLPIKKDSLSLAILPLAHVYQRVVNIGVVMQGATTAYSTPRTMPDDFHAVRPTLMAGVPRMFERIYGRILDEVRKKGKGAQRVFGWAREVAISAAKARTARSQLPFGLRVKWTLANRLVYRKIREGLGGRVELLLSGASALREDLAWFFNGIGMTLLEGYGLTEVTAPSNANPIGRVRPGTVGPPIPGVEETLAEDGEILIRGPGVFQGYLNLPEQTVAVLSPEGWFRTGDFGEFDSDGYLRFRGRKKELLKLSTAKFVAPMPIEERLKESPLVEDLVVIGDDRKFASALIQPHYETLIAGLREAGVDVPESVITWGTNIIGERVIDAVAPEILANPRAQDLVQLEVDRVNRELDPHERIRRFLLVPRRFTTSGEELTPTLKVRREIVLRKYSGEIDGLYG